MELAFFPFGAEPPWWFWAILTTLLVGFAAGVAIVVLVVARFFRPSKAWLDGDLPSEQRKMRADAGKRPNVEKVR